MLRTFVYALAAVALSLPALAQDADKPRPYDAVAITFAPAPTDKDFEAFRARLAAIAEAKDTKAVRGLLRPKRFFWERDLGGGFDRKKSSFDNFSLAASLDAEDGSGWKQLASVARERAGLHEKRRGVYCAPAEPRYDEKAFVAMLEKLDATVFEWGYPREAGKVAVRAKPDAAAEVIETLGLAFVRIVLEESTGDEPPKDTPWMRVVTPTGKVGHVATGDLLLTLVGRLCFAKDAKAGWQIAGFVGGGD